MLTIAALTTRKGEAVREDSWENLKPKDFRGKLSWATEVTPCHRGGSGSGDLPSFWELGLNDAERCRLLLGKFGVE